MQSSMVIDSDVMQIISDFSLSTGISRIHIIKQLLRKVDNLYYYTPTLANLVKYQRHKPECGFVQFQYKLTSEKKSFLRK